MRSRKAAKHQSKYIGLRAYVDADADLVAWWESYPVGERSDALRELMRSALGYQEPRPRAEDEIALLRQEVASLRQMLYELPIHMEQMINNLSSRIVIYSSETAPAAGTIHNNHNGTSSHSSGGLSDEDVLRRVQRMKKARW